MSTALFVRDGEFVVPQVAARGPWNPKALHGAAVAAVLGAGLGQDGWIVTRVSVDLLGPVPFEPMRLTVSELEGGRRVKRQTARLMIGDRELARAECLCVRQTELPIKPSPGAADSPFTEELRPSLDRGRRSGAAAIGWDCFDTLAVATRGLAVDQPERTLGLWTRLLVPAIDGEPTSALQRVLSAADFASSSVSLHLDFAQWSFMNADLTVYLSRPPVGDWVGILSSGVVQPVGSGLGIGVLYDADGHLGQAQQSLLVEPRTIRL